MLEKLKSVKRINLVLGVMIILTIPCYLAGLIVFWNDRLERTQDPSVETLTPTSDNGVITTPTFTVPVETPTETPTPTLTPTFTATITYVLPATDTPTPTLTATATLTPTASSTWTASPTATNTFTPSATATDTPVPSVESE